MKYFFTTIVLLASAGLAQAGYYNSNLSISSADGNYFAISIDGMPYGNPSLHVFTDNLTTGNHYLYIARWGGSPHFPSYRIIYSGYVFIPEASEVIAIVSRNNFKITAIRPIQCLPPTVYYQEPHYVHPQPAYYAVNDYDFSQMITSITNRSFESTRMQVAKQFINSHFFTSRQVARLLNTMTFESSKLELAKYAFAKTVDKGNYFVVNDMFTFESSITDLSRFISGQG
jgi:hypothetical protein